MFSQGRAVLLTALFSLAYVIPAAADAVDAVDPWEGLNRKIFAFNDYGDRYLLRPVASGYHYITPDPIETGISNVFSNSYLVVTLMNDLFQLKFLELGRDGARFTINTTVGLLGFFDVASKIGLEHRREDFGQTLAYYGMPSGPYIVLPFLGSSTVRDGFSLIPDAQLAPVISSIDHIPTRNQVFAANLVSKRADVLAVEQLLTGDRYSFIRDAYLQRREWLINDGAVEDNFGDEDFDDFGEEIDF
ncbi:phospholipid-binding lipoprotein MlaA [Sinobacterium caligoides]|uniref:Phospholipid-binding lipoprotein MlaA n=2 Tax=Sinobacterium caligoides TaxID=933926 RepID=A0A3N2DYQ7_9GAMM|nr:phospholipid-binding lipoprotein MlaA [Sinobacterium caligoides]